MWSLLIWSVLSADADFRVEPLAGSSFAARIVSIDDGKVVVRPSDQGDGERSIAFRDLAEMRRDVRPREDARSDIVVSLRDGSVLHAGSYTVARNEATVSLSGGENVVRIPTRYIRSVRFSRPGQESADLSRQWSEIERKELTGDAIVQKKENDDRTFYLDYWEGLLYDATAEKVQFEYEGELRDVSASKVWGLVYFRPSGGAFPSPVCRIVDADRSSWNLRELTLEGDMLHARLVSGLNVDIPVAAVARLDFSTGNVVYLGDIDYQSCQWEPFYRSGELSEQMARLFAPRRDEFRDGGKLSVGGVTYDHGLSLHSKTTLQYLVPPEMTRFVAVAGIDDRARGNGNVLLTVSGDGKRLFRETIAGDRPPQELGLDVSGVRRLTITVDFGDDLDIADYLDLCNARFLR